MNDQHHCDAQHRDEIDAAKQEERRLLICELIAIVAVVAFVLVRQRWLL
ncbi:MAG: hypothetical protein ACK5OX_07805 [Desertimonas sp.]